MPALNYAYCPAHETTLFHRGACVRCKPLESRAEPKRIKPVPAGTGVARKGLSAREIQVITLLAHGAYQENVAECLGIARVTVAGILRSAKRRVGVQSMGELWRHVTQQGAQP